MVSATAGSIPYYDPAAIPGDGDPVKSGGRLLVTLGSVWLARRVVGGTTSPETIFMIYRTAAELGLQQLQQWRFAEKLVIGGAPFSRFDDTDPLAHELRSELYDRIVTAPGIHLSSLVEDTGSPLSTVRHHLRVLEREDLIESRKIAGKRRLLPFDMVNSAEQLAAVADESTFQIIRFLGFHGPADVSTIADRLNLDPSTISYHLSRLEAVELVERHREGRSISNQLTQVAVKFVTPRPLAASEDEV